MNSDEIIKRAIHKTEEEIMQHDVFIGFIPEDDWKTACRYALQLQAQEIFKELEETAGINEELEKGDYPIYTEIKTKWCGE